MCFQKSCDRAIQIGRYNWLSLYSIGFESILMCVCRCADNRCVIKSPNLNYYDRFLHSIGLRLDSIDMNFDKILEDLKTKE